MAKKKRKFYKKQEKKTPKVPQPNPDAVDATGEDKPEPKEGGKEDGMVLEGVVVESLRGKFRVEILQEGEDPGSDRKKHQVLAHLAGKLRQNWIKIVPGDKVNVEVSPYDITRGRIVYRLKK